VRGSYYDGYRPSCEPNRIRDQDEFLDYVLSAHLPRGQCEKVRDSLPEDIKVLWHLDEAQQVSREDKADTGRAAQHAHEARTFRARHSAAGISGDAAGRRKQTRYARARRDESPAEHRLSPEAC
jgi:hypothetical protein